MIMFETQCHNHPNILSGFSMKLFKVFDKVQSSTTPKTSTYEQQSHQCHSLKWSELYSNMKVDPEVFMCNCQSRLPQQVALTEFRNQINAQVKVIVVTLWGSFIRMYFPINEREDSEINNTTPTNSTYCSENSSLCFY